MAGGQLSGKRVIVAGAGLAGLSAARDLEAAGASVFVADARDRVGGRVHTLRRGFTGGLHAEAGADLIEDEQSFVLELARELGLKPVRILRGGFKYYGPDRSGRRRLRSAEGAFGGAAPFLKQEIADYCLAGQRWDSAVAQQLGRQSVASWLATVHADAALTAGMRGLRGFFLADPEELSLLALVDQLASSGPPGGSQFYRISGGNDRLPGAIARALRGGVHLQTIVRRIRQRLRGVRVTLEERGRGSELHADYCVAALPASTLREVEFDPALPAEQSRAIGTLNYGDATRLLLQFDEPFWRRRGRPRAFASDLPIGAVWDGAEDQRAGAAILSLLAGGRASRALRLILDSESERGVVDRLAWIGAPATLLTTHRISWEDEPWSRGGYAVFGPSFDPPLRSWLARPAGRVVFAGEHTSLRWQGYMNGAVESGRRAAAEVRALSSQARSPS